MEKEFIFLRSANIFKNDFTWNNHLLTLLLVFNSILQVVSNNLKMIVDNFVPSVSYTFVIAVAIALCLKLCTW